MAKTIWVVSPAAQRDVLDADIRACWKRVSKDPAKHWESLELTDEGRTVPFFRCKSGRVEFWLVVMNEDVIYVVLPSDLIEAN